MSTSDGKRTITKGRRSTTLLSGGSTWRQPVALGFPSSPIRPGQNELHGCGIGDDPPQVAETPEPVSRRTESWSNSAGRCSITISDQPANAFQEHRTVPEHRREGETPDPSVGTDIEELARRLGGVEHLAPEARATLAGLLRKLAAELDQAEPSAQKEQLAASGATCSGRQRPARTRARRSGPGTCGASSRAGGDQSSGSDRPCPSIDRRSCRSGDLSSARKLLNLKPAFPPVVVAWLRRSRRLIGNRKATHLR